MLVLRHNDRKIKMFPDRLISDNLKKIFLNIVEIGKFNENDYKALSMEESQLFDDIITTSKMDTNDIFYKHRKYNADLVNDSINRMLILKGEILAGNDSKEVLREFKVQLLTLLKHNIINQKTYADLLAEIIMII